LRQKLDVQVSVNEPRRRGKWRHWVENLYG